MSRLSSVIPNSTKEALKSYNWQIENISLLLNKYLDFLEIKNEKILSISEVGNVKNISFLPLIKDDKVFEIALKKVFNINERQRKFKINGKDYDRDFVINLKNGVKAYRRYIKNNVLPNLNTFINQINQRQKAISDLEFSLQTISRLIVGLGSSSVLETSITLHHIYGIPYIPSSAIKGVFRAYKIWKLADWDSYKFIILEEFIENYEDKSFEKLKNSLIEKLNSGKLDKKLKNIDETLEDDDFKKMRTDLIEYIKNLDKEEIKKIVKTFGNQGQKGKLVIFDAYPEKFEGFDIDVMNPHYPEYYKDVNPQPPADWQNPTPITFLTIPAGTKFKFFFKNTNVYDEDLKEDLKNAFLNIGIGGKTALGYGILNDTNS